MDGMIDKYLPIIKEMAATIRREHGLSEILKELQDLDNQKVALPQKNRRA